MIMGQGKLARLSIADFCAWAEGEERPAISSGTLPIGCDAEGWLWLTVSWLSNRLPSDDWKFIEKAMRAYGRGCAEEALARSVQE